MKNKGAMNQQAAPVIGGIMTEAERQTNRENFAEQYEQLQERIYKRQTLFHYFGLPVYVNSGVDPVEITTNNINYDHLRSCADRDTQRVKNMLNERRPFPQEGDLLLNTDIPVAYVRHSLNPEVARGFLIYLYERAIQYYNQFDNIEDFAHYEAVDFKSRFHEFYSVFPVLERWEQFLREYKDEKPQEDKDCEPVDATSSLKDPSLLTGQSHPGVLLKPREHYSLLMTLGIIDHLKKDFPQYMSTPNDKTRLLSLLMRVRTSTIKKLVLNDELPKGVTAHKLERGGKYNEYYDNYPHGPNDSVKKRMLETLDWVNIPDPRGRKNLK